MRALAASLVLILVWSSPSAMSQSERSVWDGVYTDSQAGRGQKVFERVCSACHMVEDFKGSSFIGGWESSAVLDLFSKIQRTMPMDQPGSLDPQEYIDVVAYFFKVNEFPSGKTELDADAEHLKQIRIQATKN
jgi:mono/diheme cytochrome c family protein